MSEVLGRIADAAALERLLGATRARRVRLPERDAPGDTSVAIGATEFAKVNPFENLRDVIMRVGSHPARDVLEFSPKIWKQKLQDFDAARSAPPTAA